MCGLACRRPARRACRGGPACQVARSTVKQSGSRSGAGRSVVQVQRLLINHPPLLTTRTHTDNGEGKLRSLCDHKLRGRQRETTSAIFPKTGYQRVGPSLAAAWRDVQNLLIRAEHQRREENHNQVICVQQLPW